MGSADRTLSPRGRGQGEGAQRVPIKTPQPPHPNLLPLGEKERASLTSSSIPGTVPNLVPLARTLRKNQTDAERLLWSRLRNRHLGGWKFKRQVPIGPYIADFLCADAWLIVELDGGHHNSHDVAVLDRRRTEELEGRRYLVVRFWNAEATTNLDGVCDTILDLVRGAQGHVF